MKSLIRALTEYFEARAELLREEAAMLHLGKFAEGYQAGVEDSSDFEIVYIDETEDGDG